MAATIIQFPVERTKQSAPVEQPMTRSMAQYNDFRGSKYDGSLDTAEIAKRFRADVKAAEKAGELPKGLKLSVRISRYSGGSSINVDVKDAAGLAIMNPKRVAWDIENPHRFCDMPSDVSALHTEAGRALLQKLELMLGAYNFDKSDSQTDYFHVNFYSTVRFAWELEKAERERIAGAI